MKEKDGPTLQMVSTYSVHQSKFIVNRHKLSENLIK